jgi:hypothetical protein
MFNGMGKGGRELGRAACSGEVVALTIQSSEKPDYVSAFLSVGA